MLMSRADIAGMIPHSGTMCLLDGVLEWDSDRIRCSAKSHRDDQNPLRVAGRLPAVCAIEYAAQAMAVHGRLTGDVSSQPRTGYLASLRDVSCKVDRLDELEEDLIVEVEKLVGNEARVIYRFTLNAAGVEVMSGQAAVVLDVRGSTS